MQDEVIFEQRGSIGLAQLNRSKALNALNHDMVKLLAQQYAQWSSDERVQCILIQGSPKAFCAGGDVKKTVLQIREGKQRIVKRFFYDEYKLNHQLATLRKPHVAFIDGVTLGGGAGISVHGTFRIATERTLFAMPEIGIGLFPDVGATYFLPRLPGSLGVYLGVTGTRLKGFQVLEAGLATHFVSSDKLDALREDLQRLGARAGDPTLLEQLLSSYQEASTDEAKPSGLLEDLPEINSAFGHDSMEGIQAALAAFDKPWASAAAAALLKGSKLSQKITLRAIQLGRGMSLAECLRMEYKLVSNIVDSPNEFDEGIRAVLIDKDNKPRWRPSTLEQVTKEQVDAFFAPLSGEEELRFRAVNSRL